MAGRNYSPGFNLLCKDCSICGVIRKDLDVHHKLVGLYNPVSERQLIEPVGTCNSKGWLYSRVNYLFPISLT